MYQLVDLFALRHGGCGAGARDRNTRGRTAEAHGIEQWFAFGECGGEASAKGVAGAGGFDDRAGVERGHNGGRAIGLLY